MHLRLSHRFICVFVLLLLTRCNTQLNDLPKEGKNFPFSLIELQRRSFNYFWETVYPYGQVPDRYPTKRMSSIAATGFGLTSYIIGAERGYITRDQAIERVLLTLESLWTLPVGADSSGISGYKGFFYHFLKYEDATRYRNVELSTIDTGLLMAGILSTQSYFTGSGVKESRIRELADLLYRRVNWNWAYHPDQGTICMGWRPERGWIPSYWKGYNEAMILLIMAMGSPSYPVPVEAWANWCSTYQWMEFQGYEHVNFTPLFGHQYSHMYIDFRGIQDDYMRGKGIDYFENSRRGTLSNRAYCIDNPSQFTGYGEKIWGLTACDGPAKDGQFTIDDTGDTLLFRGYWARGASGRHINDDGTIAPTAAGGSIPFAPDECIETLSYLWENHYDLAVDSFGFKDAINLSYVNDQYPQGWADIDYLGIDQGPIVIQIENHLSGLIWDQMKKNKYIVDGLKKAGFTGGWIDAL